MKTATKITLLLTLIASVLIPVYFENTLNPPSMIEKSFYIGGEFIEGNEGMIGLYYIACVPLCFLVLTMIIAGAVNIINKFTKLDM